MVADPDRACLILETGVNERFSYGRYRRTPESTEEAQAWEAAKRTVKCAPSPSCLLTESIDYVSTHARATPWLAAPVLKPESRLQ